METTDFNMLYAIFWYITGIFSYKIVTKVLGLGNATLLFQEALLGSIALLKHANDNFEVASQSAYEGKLESDKDAALASKESDEQTLTLWRRLAVLNLINLTPKKLRFLITFKDWRGAMKYLNKKGLEDAEY